MIPLIGKGSLIVVGTVHRKLLVLIKGLHQVAWIADLTIEVAWLWILIKLRVSGLASLMLIIRSAVLALTFKTHLGQCRYGIQ